MKKGASIAPSNTFRCLRQKVANHHIRYIKKMIKSKKIISSFDDQDEIFFSTFNLVRAKKFAPDLDPFSYLILLYVKLRSFFLYSFYYYYYYYFFLPFVDFMLY